MSEQPTSPAGLQRVCSEPPKPRVRGRPWPKGMSGNPSGRRKGTVSLTAALKRLLTTEDASAIVRKVVDLAKNGDLRAIELLFQRLDDAAVERRIRDLEEAMTRINGRYEN